MSGAMASAAATDRTAARRRALTAGPGRKGGFNCAMLLSQPGCSTFATATETARCAEIKKARPELVRSGPSSNYQSCQSRVRRISPRLPTELRDYPLASGYCQDLCPEGPGRFSFPLLGKK